MFQAILRRSSPRVCLGARPLSQRSLSYLSKHSVFPATLYRFQTQRESNLYDRKLEQDDWEHDEGVEVSSDGLVHPKIEKHVSNGALLRPNTHLMQELTRGSHDNYLDGVNDGKPVAEPHYICVPKGTVIPSSLTLFREWGSQFSLQPSYPTSLTVLNESLTKFYAESCYTVDPEEWLDRNPYHEAGFDDSEDWMMI